jgi:hypothetical protein
LRIINILAKTKPVKMVFIAFVNVAAMLRTKRYNSLFGVIINNKGGI